MRSVSLLAALIVCACVTDAHAQGVQRPARPYRGLFGGGAPANPDQSRQEFSLTASLLGGYDKQVAPEGAFTPNSPAQTQTSNTFTGDLNLTYFTGRTGRSFTIDGRAFTTTYSQIDDSAIGAEARLRGETSLGRRARFTASQALSYAPNLVLGTFGVFGSNVDTGLLPDSGDGNGFGDQRSWSSTSEVTLERGWTPRQSTTAGYNYSRRMYLDSLGHNDVTNAGYVSYRWAYSRESDLQASYRVSHAEFDDQSQQGDETTPMTDQSFEGGWGYTRRLSPTRQVQLSVGGGATHVSTLNSDDRLPISYWMPSGYGMFRMGVGRSWSLAADYRRGVSVPQGATLESFATNAFSINADGAIGRRIESAFSFGYSNGQSGEAQGTGSFSNYGGNAQMRYAFSRCCAASLTYDYYFYKLNGISDTPLGLPREYDRSSVRVGFTFWLPLYGSYDRSEGTTR